MATELTIKVPNRAGQLAAEWSRLSLELEAAEAEESLTPSAR